mmetsp:Transcript_6570/g.15499  ORF Transcript_6570/g.15499 Transcript_6570/m.15499 type:complete len:614 (+) Transcript_6570:117-1958(+)
MSTRVSRTRRAYETDNLHNHNNLHNQEPQPDWQESIRHGFHYFLDATSRPAAGFTELVTQTLPKATNLAWTKCGMDTINTWEEFDFGNNSFEGGSNFFRKDYNANNNGNINGNDTNMDGLDQLDGSPTGAVQRDPFQFTTKPNQPTSRRKHVATNSNWANFDALRLYNLQAVCFSPQTTATTATTDDDTFFDNGSPMRDNRPVLPITQVFPMVTPIPELGQQMDESEKENSKLKSARFRFFGGRKSKVVPVPLPVTVQSNEKREKREQKRLRRKEEQRLKELHKETEREQDRIRRKEARLKREEERIVQEEERMMREEEERERRREEEIWSLEDERKERQQRKENFERKKDQKDQKQIFGGTMLHFDDIEEDESFEVDWQGFPPPRPRRRERRLRKQSKTQCITCSCPSCSDCCRNNKKIFVFLLVLLVLLVLLAGAGVGIYFALAKFDVLKGDGDAFELSEDCQSVIGGYSVPNESLYPTVRLSWVMDISTEPNWPSTPQLTSEIRNQFQEMAIPTLAGCMSPPRDELVDDRYGILNGFVRTVRDVGSCREGEPRPCARLLVDFVIYVKGASPVPDLISHVSAMYSSSVADAITQVENVRQTRFVGLFEQRI